MRKTKIICTIGPASENEETLTQMCLAGMNVARLNFSHGSYEEQGKRIALIKKVRQKLGLPIAIMLDTKGPEYRIRTFASGKVNIEDGADFTFTTDEVEGDETRVSVSYKNLHNELKPGNEITVNNGMLRFAVESIEGTNIHCRCITGGALSNRKSMSFPNKVCPDLTCPSRIRRIFSLVWSMGWISLLPPSFPASRMCWTSRNCWIPMAAAILKSWQKSKTSPVWTT